jgi:hypothetical protein
MQNQATKEGQLRSLHILDVVDNYTFLNLQLLFFCQFIHRLSSPVGSGASLSARYLSSVSFTTCPTWGESSAFTSLLKYFRDVMIVELSSIM